LDGAKDERRLETGTEEWNDGFQAFILSKVDLARQLFCTCDIAALIEDFTPQRPFTLAAGVQKAPVCGVIAGVGNKPEGRSGGRIGRFETLPHEIGSSALGIVYGLVGVESLDSKYAREPDSAGGVGKLDGPRSSRRWGGLKRFELLTPPNSTPSRAGVR
jgi:hypothetical protein